MCGDSTHAFCFVRQRVQIPSNFDWQSDDQLTPAWTPAVKVTDVFGLNTWAVLTSCFANKDWIRWSNSSAYSLTCDTLGKLKSLTNVNLLILVYIPKDLV